MELEDFVRSKKSIKLNSIWKKLERTGFRFYCVSCDRERLLSVPARAGSFQAYVHVLVTTAFLMLITWPLFHFKGVVLFIPVWAVFEVLYRMKMRAALVCPDCDFDPVLFMVDRDQAVQKVEDVWRRKFEEKGYPFPEHKKNGQLRRKVAAAVITENPLPNVESNPSSESPESRA